MRRVLPFILAASLAAAFAGASAQTAPVAGTTPTAPATTAAPAATDAAPAANTDDVVSCRYEKTTGSLFAKRICHTQREWRQMTTDSRDLMDHLDNRSSVSSGLGGGN